MSHRRFHVPALILTLVLMLPAAVRAQIQIPPSALEQVPQASPIQPAAPDLTEWFERGELLESEGRWGEAVGVWDEAVHTHPDDLTLQERRTIARIHFDLSRRYADTGYLTAVTTLSENEALGQYREVLEKIEQHYVHQPDWANTVARGSYSLEVALVDASFIGQCAPQSTARQREACIRNLRATLAQRTIRNREEALSAVSAAARVAQRDLGITPTAVVLEYTCGATGALDLYSSYLTAAQLDDLYSQIEGNFVGLGIEIKPEDNALLLVSVIPGSPAEASGLLAGEKIVSVDGQQTDVISTEVAAEMLKGEEGSVVTVGLLAPDGSAREIRVRRARVEVPSVVNVHIENEELGVGYFRITSFQKTTCRDVDAALWELNRQGMRSLIIDLRGNPGGLLTSSVELADKFLTQGTIVSTRGRSAREDFDYRAHEAGTWRVPLIVLIDRDSASASEIFAGAIRDHSRGAIVGQRSYGKGSVQGIFPLASTGAGVRLTTAKFYSPSGQAISDRGVDPTVAVQVTARPTDRGFVPVGQEPEDVVMTAAMQVAREQVTRLP